MVLIAALATLYELLAGIDTGKVIAAVENQSRIRLLIAGILVAAGYMNLIAYDLFALHTIGKSKVPLRVAAFASFTSYTIGHSLGAATLTCGLLRLRVYSSWSLSIGDIARIAFVTGMTFWLGNIFALGAVLAYAPSALGTIDRLPDWVNRAVGLAGLCLIGCYLLWLLPRRRVVGRANWTIALPGVRGTLLQIGIGSLDRILASLSIYMLMPPSPPVGFFDISVIYVFATLLGAVSHAPGSLGVVEAAILVGLPQYPREALLATLVSFRMLDFFFPLALATLMFAGRELRLLLRRNAAKMRATAYPPGWRS